MLSFIKDNGGVLAILALVAVLLGAYAEWRIAEKVDERIQGKLDAIAAVSPDRMKAAEDRITRTEEADDKMDDKITRIIDILLEE